MPTQPCLQGGQVVLLQSVAAFLPHFGPGLGMLSKPVRPMGGARMVRPMGGA